MQITTIPIQKLRITDVAGLDPVDAFLEDHGPGKGQLIVRCFDRSWTAGWGAMGKETVAEFVRTCGTDYVVNCLARGLSARSFSGDALVELAKRTVLGRRRSSLQVDRDDYETWDAAEAREVYDQLSDLRVDRIEHAPDALMQKLFGDEWWHLDHRVTEPNPDYVYLTRIVATLQQALGQLKGPTAVAA